MCENYLLHLYYSAKKFIFKFARQETLKHIFFRLATAGGAQHGTPSLDMPDAAQFWPYPNVTYKLERETESEHYLTGNTFDTSFNLHFFFSINNNRCQMCATN